MLSSQNRMQSMLSFYFSFFSSNFNTFNFLAHCQTYWTGILFELLHKEHSQKYSIIKKLRFSKNAFYPALFSCEVYWFRSFSINVRISFSSTHPRPPLYSVLTTPICKFPCNSIILFFIFLNNNNKNSNNAKFMFQHIYKLQHNIYMFPYDIVIYISPFCPDRALYTSTRTCIRCKVNLCLKQNLFPYHHHLCDGGWANNIKQKTYKLQQEIWAEKN